MIASAAIARRVEVVRGRVAEAAVQSGRDPAEIRIIAVSKGCPPEAMEAAVAAGVHDLGEARVREAETKRRVMAAADGAVCWHLIGQLQRNKASRAAAAFDVIHSVDRPALVATLAERVRSEPLDVLMQVDLTGLPGRGGVAPGDLLSLVSLVAEHAPSLRPRGLMTIAPPEPANARPCFARLRDLRDEMVRATGLDLPELSMGMSGDFEAAIREGATMVRVGRAIFG